MLSDWDLIDPENQQVFKMQEITIAMQLTFSIGEKSLEMVFMKYSMDYMKGQIKHQDIKLIFFYSDF